MSGRRVAVPVASPLAPVAFATEVLAQVGATYGRRRTRLVGLALNLLLDAGHGVARILAVRNLALATVIVPVALGVTLAAQVLAPRAPDLGRASLADVGAVFCWLGVGSVLSVLLPYRPLPWRARLALPRTWVRWAACVGAPWVAVLGLEPALRLGDRAVGSWSDGGPLALGVLFWVLGLAGAAVLARRHARTLRHRLRMSE